MLTSDKRRLFGTSSVDSFTFVSMVGFFCLDFLYSSRASARALDGIVEKVIRPACDGTSGGIIDRSPRLAETLLVSRTKVAIIQFEAPEERSERRPVFLNVLSSPLC